MIHHFIFSSFKLCTRYLAVIPLFLVFGKSHAQTMDTLTSDYSTWKGQRFYLNGEKISKQEVFNLFGDNEFYKNKLKSGLKQQSIAVAISSLGGFLIGYPLGQKLGGSNDPSWHLLGIGAGIVALSIPLDIASKHNITEAFDFFNNTLIGDDYRRNSVPIVQIVNGKYGIGFRFLF